MLDVDPRRAVRRPGGARAHRQPRAGRALGRRRVHQRPAPLAALRRVGRFRRAPRLRRRATTSGAWTGGCSARTDRFYIKEYEADTNANFSVLLDVSKSMGFGSRGITKLDYAQDARRLPDLPRAPAARPRRPRRLRRRHRRVRAAVGQAHGRRAPHARSAEAVAARAACAAPLHKLAEHFGAPRAARADLRFLRGSGGGARGGRRRCASAATT